MGSLASMATVEMEESVKKVDQEKEMIKLDPTRIDSTVVTITTPVGIKVEITAENDLIAHEMAEQGKIVYFLSKLPIFKQIKFLDLPEKVILSIAATFMGLLGFIIMLIKESVYDKIPLSPDLILKRSLLGFSSGLFVIVLSYVLPSVLTLDANGPIQIETLTTFSLLAGMFFKNVLERVNQNFTS